MKVILEVYFTEMIVWHPSGNWKVVKIIVILYIKLITWGKRFMDKLKIVDSFVKMYFPSVKISLTVLRTVSLEYAQIKTKQHRTLIKRAPTIQTFAWRSLRNSEFKLYNIIVTKLCMQRTIFDCLSRIGGFGLNGHWKQQRRLLLSCFSSYSAFWWIIEYIYGVFILNSSSLSFISIT